MRPAKPRELWLNAIEANLSSSLGKEGRGEILFREVLPETPAAKRVRLARAKVLRGVRRSEESYREYSEAVATMLEAEAAERRERRAGAR